ncbi:MAG: class I SAM-dependent methyltransferase, partial [Kiloniellales bacterium]
MLFRLMLKNVIREGSVRLIDAHGRSFTFGDGSGKRCTLRLHRKVLDYKLVLNPPLYIGEAYMDGDITVEEGTLYDFLEIAARNYGHLERLWYVKLFLLLARHARWVKQYNPIGKAQRNVAHHYDLSEELYKLFLDSDQQYSCAYFDTPHDSLEKAQENKKRHLAAKLLLDRPGLKLLD